MYILVDFCLIDIIYYFLGKKFDMKTTHSSQSINFSPINNLKNTLFP